MYDTIIIGAGPAGSVAGYNLAKKNFKVLIIDKQRFPREKTCACGIPVHITQLVDFDFEPIIKENINKIRFAFNGKDFVEYKSEKNFLKTSYRKEFDYFLLEKAIKQGVVFKEKETLIDIREYKDIIEIYTDKNKYKTKYLIGADGALSKVNKILKIVKKDNIGFAINIHIKIKDIQKWQNCVLIDNGNKIENGYFWIFSKKDVLAIGIASNKYKNKNLKSIFFDFLKMHNIDIEKNQILKFSSGFIPPYNGEKNLVKHNTLLVGDAGNLVDTLTGEGIFYAIKSGQLASKAIENSFLNNTQLSEYNKSLSEIFNNLDVSKKLAYIFYTYPKIVYKLAVKNKKIIELFLNYVIEDLDYKKAVEILKNKYLSFRKEGDIKKIKKILLNYKR